MLVNLIIIYFACGSPIGVYRITRSTNSRSRRFAAIGAYFILWPIFVPTILRRSLSANGRSETNIEREMANIRRNMEKTLLAETTKVALSEFREVFSRFTGLTMALNRDGKANPADELLDIAMHKNKSLALACQYRRNRHRLLFHQIRTRDEFVELISVSSFSHPKGEEIVKLGLQLAHLLNDQKTVHNLLSRLDRNSKHFAAGN